MAGALTDGRYLQAAVFLYPRASTMLQGVTEDDVGPNTARWLPVG
jgi:hypothetical protein